jgi:hypothetical protein
MDTAISDTTTETLSQTVHINIQLESELVSGLHAALESAVKDKTLATGHQKDAITIARLVAVEAELVSAELATTNCAL